MNIVICGAGEVGRHAAEVLGNGADNITIIDKEYSKLVALEQTMDVRILHGNAAHVDLLREAGCANADLFLAATHIDEINLLSASLAKAVGAKQVIARVHHSAFFERKDFDYGKQLGIDHLVCPEFTTAAAIAQTLRTPGALAVERVAMDQVEVRRLPVVKGAKAVGSPLMALNLPEATRIASIERGGAVFLPDGHTRMDEGDVVTLLGDTAVFEKAARLFDPEAAKRKHVVILGSTGMGVWLCRALRGRGFSIRLVADNQERAEELASKLDWVTVLYADAADASIFEEERFGDADAFVALSEEDERNILAAARAKTMGVSEAIAVLQRSTYLHLIEHVGIDHAFSPRVTAVGQIKQLLDQSPIKHLASLGQGVAEVFELKVPANAPAKVIGCPLHQINFPSKTMIGAIGRGATAHVPGASSELQPGDTVVIIGPGPRGGTTEKNLAKLFGISR